MKNLEYINVDAYRSFANAQDDTMGTLTYLSSRTERSAVKDLEYIKWVFPRFFANALNDTMGRNGRYFVILNEVKNLNK